jgi:secreted PhoX family phosphatase
MAGQYTTVRADDHEDAGSNTSANPSLETLMQSRLSRRRVLAGGAGAVAIAALGGTRSDSAEAHGYPQHGLLLPGRTPRLGFEPVAKSLEDAVIVPRGYSYDVLYALGDPIARGVADYRNDGTDAAVTFAHRAGDHHDGIHYFGLGSNGRCSRSSSERGLLCMNHEAITPSYLHPTGQTIVNGARTVPEEVLREFYAHGVSIIEVTRQRNRKRSAWSAAYSLARRTGPATSAVSQRPTIRTAPRRNWPRSRATESRERAVSCGPR